MPLKIKLDFNQFYALKGPNLSKCAKNPCFLSFLYNSNIVHSVLPIYRDDGGHGDEEGFTSLAYLQDAGRLTNYIRV